MRMKFTLSAIALAAAPALFASAVPASAATPFDRAPIAAPARAATVDVTQDVWEHSRKYRNNRHYNNRSYRNYSRNNYYGERVSRNTRVWHGRDGRYYCRKENGTTGLLVGGAVGALAGHEIAGRGDRTLGALLGAAGGALLGRAIDLSDSRCR